MIRITTKKKGNKRGNVKTVYNGRKYDSKFEASVARDLDMRIRAGEIVAVVPQYKVVIPIYNKIGVLVYSVTHKVDFRVTELNGSYTLIEAKGFETQDYKFRRKLLKEIFLKDNLNYSYQVIYLNGSWRNFKP